MTTEETKSSNGKPGVSTLLAGLGMMAVAVAWPLIAIRLGFKSASMMPMVCAFGGITAATGVAQLLTGIQHPYGDFNGYNGWRKGVVLLFGVAGFAGGLVAHFRVTDYVKDAGYSIVHKDGDKEWTEESLGPIAPSPMTNVLKAAEEALRADAGW